jgi:putative FmdB family regulatory protein
MPIYAYRCAACGHSKDVLQKMSDPVLTVCPNCGADTFQKQVTAAGFQLKGSGWYVTDFRGGAKPASENGSAEAAAGDKKADSKTADANAPDTKATDTKNGDSTPAPAAKSDSAAPAAAPTSSSTPAAGAK